MGLSLKGITATGRTLIRSISTYIASFLLKTNNVNAAQNNTIIDSSVNNLTVTRFGNVTQGKFSPYSVSENGGSLYFDGTGDYLSFGTGSGIGAFQSNNFTIEGWYYLTTDGSSITDSIFYYNYLSAFNAGAIYFGKHVAVGGRVAFWAANVSGVAPVLSDPTLPPVNQWVHYALTRSGTTITLWRDGVSVATATTAASLTGSTVEINYVSTLSASFGIYGYVSDFRIVNGTAVYTSTFTPPTVPLTAVTNTQALLSGKNAGIFDSTAESNIETVGSARVSTAVAKFAGTSSVEFNGSTDFMRLTAPTALGAGDFTIETWAYLSGINRYAMMYSTRSAAGASSPTTQTAFFIDISNKLTFLTDGSTSGAQAPTLLAINTWYHLAATRQNGTIRLFINGVLGATLANKNDNFSAPVATLGSNVNGSEPFFGYLQDMRITDGAARYTANFTPPAEPF